MRCDLGHGIYLRDATQEDWDELVATMREGDRAEHEALGGGRIDASTLEDSVAVMHETAGLIGVWGSDLMHRDTAMSTVRAWAYLTTRNVDKIKRTYVRMTRPVLRALWAREKPWVTRAAVIPMDDYTMSNNWLKKCLGAVETDMKFVEGGKGHTVHLLMREEA